MDLFEMFERDGRDRRGGAATQPRRGGIRGFFDRVMSGGEEDDDKREYRRHDRSADTDDLDERERRSRRRDRDDDRFDLD